MRSGEPMKVGIVSDTHGQAAALQAADNRTKEILYQMDNEDCCCETKLLVAEAAGETAGLIAATGAGAIRDSLAAAQQEALMLRLRRRC